MKICTFPDCTGGDCSLEAYRACQECSLYPALTLADDIRQEEESLRRRFIHHTRPKGPLSLKEAIELAERVSGREQGVPNGH